jgi:hypothetical protein
MTPIPFRRRVKNLSKDLQRNQNNHSKCSEILEHFQRCSGINFRHITYVNAFLKTDVKGSAMARVGRAAIKMNCYVDAWDIYIMRAHLHEVPFYKEIKIEKD